MVERRWIPDFPGYSATSDGRVFSHKRRKRPDTPLDEPVRELTKIAKSIGYRCVSLSRDGKAVQVYVHFAILTTFAGPRPVGHHCRHKDGTRDNNRIENLCWGTPKENMADTAAHGRMWVGDRNGKSVLTQKDVAFILAHLEWSSRLIAQQLGCHPATIDDIKKGRSWGWFTGIKANNTEATEATAAR